MKHIPVLLEEAIQYLDPKPNQNFIDCTLGTGGHTQEILKKTLPSGKVLAIDANAETIKIAEKRLKEFSKRIIFHQGNFANIKTIASSRQFTNISGILFDFGLSSILLDKEYGFSFKKSQPLLMNFGGNSNLTAEKILNSYPSRKLTEIISKYGEERYALKIAQKICFYRRQKLIKTTDQLVEIIRSVVPANYENSRLHPATRTFQALRIEVNNELKVIKDGLKGALEILAPEGRTVCLSYHSLEDRIVKDFFKQEARNCVCPKEIDVCQCGHKAKLKIITKKPIVASAEEIGRNPRARSAKMRVAEKI